MDVDLSKTLTHLYPCFFFCICLGNLPGVKGLENSLPFLPIYISLPLYFVNYILKAS